MMPREAGTTRDCTMAGGEQVRATVAASALMLTLAEPAFSAEKQSWGFVQSGKDVLLSYGVPESESITLPFWCYAAPKRIEIVNTVLPGKPRKGQPLTTTLRNGAGTAAYAGKIGQDAGHETFHFAASTAAEPKVVDILKSGTTLTIGIPGKQDRVPLRGVAKPLAQFEAACFGRR